MKLLEIKIKDKINIESENKLKEILKTLSKKFLKNNSTIKRKIDINGNKWYIKFELKDLDYCYISISCKSKKQFYLIKN